MCEKEPLVAYLYDDLADGDRATFESHLRGCAACRDELKALRGVRGDLAMWAPPQPDFGFRMMNVRGGRQTADGSGIAVGPRPVPSWRAWWAPAAGLAAAAVLVLAAALSIAHVEVHRGRDGLTVRTGWSAFAPAGSSGSSGETGPNRQGAVLTAAGPASPTPRSGEGADAAFLAGIERRLHALEASSSRDSGLRNASTLSARASEAEIIKRVRELLAQSENKQQGELALRISQVIRDVDAQRVADLSRIQQGLGRIDASVTAEAAAHRDLTNYILTSARQK